MRAESFCTVAVLLCLSSCAIRAQEKAAAFPTNEEMRHFKKMSDPHLSPDAKQVLITITESTADGARDHLWLIDVDSSATRQLTYSPESDKHGESHGDWMPDGQSILFLAHRGEHTVLYRLPMAGGEARPFDLKVNPIVDRSKEANALPPPKPGEDKEDKAEPIAIDVSAYKVAPDGTQIALIADDPETPGEKKQKDAKADASWVDHDPHGSRLYLLDTTTDKLDKLDKPDKLTPIDVPCDVRSASWSADSTKLIVLAEGENGLSELGPAMSSWLVTRSDLPHPVKLTNLPATINAASWSADGLSLGYLAKSKVDAPPGYTDLYRYTFASKSTRNLTDGIDGTIGRQLPLALADGTFLDITEKGVDLVLVKYGADHPSATLAKFPLATLSSATTNSKQNGWVFLGSSGSHAPALYFSRDLTITPRLLATPSLSPANITVTAAKRVHWQSDRFPIDGLLYLPPGVATHKVPLIVEVHGGPLGSYSDSFSPFTDFLLGHGWAVLRTNPRGGTGRGAAFAAANKNDLGGGDYRDIMAGVDFVLKTEAIDPDKLALMGYSYGGEMAGFVEVKTTRFKAIVSAAPVIDQFSEYGTEDASWYDQWYYGKPWEHQADAWRQSPLSGVAHARTPFLLIQGEGDTTDPLGQSQEMYRALRQAGVAVDLVTYPRDNHVPLANALYGNPTPEPWHGFDARQRVVAFFQKAFDQSSK